MLNTNKIKNVLITGATKGLGLQIAKEFAKIGATAHITHRWGSVSEDTIYSEFKNEKLPKPYIYRSNVGDEKSNLELIETIASNTKIIDVFVSNVSFAQVVDNFFQMKKNTLDLSIQYSAWPIVSITQNIYNILGSFPRYIIGVSSNGPDICYPRYEFAGCSKAVLETLTKYMAVRLRNYECNINCIRPGFLKTDSSIATLGVDTINRITDGNNPTLLTCEEVAKVCIALTSGYMNAVTGQIINIDNAQGLVSPTEYFSKTK